jgi:ribosomal protein S12 methylthiotransferase accessory factor
MSEKLQLSFPGGKRVDVHVGGFHIATDQSEKHGGAGSAPAPFTLFLASLASCSGIFALNFCQSRDIDTTGLALSMEWDGDGKRPERSVARLHLRLPDGFPDQYRDGIVRAIELCAVKRQLGAAPSFEVAVTASD